MLLPFLMVGAIGLAVILGWVLDIAVLYRVHPELAPMQFNNAVCFLLSAAAAMLVAVDRTNAAAVFSALGLLLSGLTLIQYPLNIDLGIDLMLFNTNEMVLTANPGRMAPNSATAHLLSFICLLLLSKRTVLAYRIAGVISTVVFVLGFSSLLMYSVDANSVFEWGTLTKMAVNTSIGFSMLGIGLSWLSIRQVLEWVKSGLITNFHIWKYLSVLLVGTLIIEVQLPQNIATGLMYAVVVALTWASPRKRDFFIVAGIATGIVIFDFVISSAASGSIIIDANRVISIVSAWFAASVLFYFKSESEKLDRSRSELSKANNQLKEAQLKFEAIFDNTYQFIGLLETDGTLIEANQTALDFAGVTLEQARGQKFWDSPWWSLSEEIRNQVKDAVQRAASGEFVRYDVDNLGADGSVVTVDFSLRPVKNEFGEVIYLIPEGRDISSRIELEEKLLKSEREFRTIFETIDEGIVYQNKNGEITNANHAAERILGITLDQMKGVRSIDPRWRALHEDGSDFPGEEHPAMMALKTGKEQRDVIQGIFHPGKEDYVWITANSYPVIDDATGQVSEVYSTFEDITEEYRAKQALLESEKRFNLAVKGTTAGVWDWLDVSKEEEWWSPRFYELLGYEPSELTASVQTFRELLHPDDIEFTFKLVERHFEKKTPFTVEYRLKHKSGKYKWFLGSGHATWTEDGKPKRMVGTIVDIHARKMAEKAEIERSKELAIKNKELEEFAYIASHDLQEPVRTISSFVELFREIYMDKLDDQGREFLDLMEGATTRSQKLIVDLLAYSRIGRHKELVDVDMNKMIDHLLTDLSVRIKESGATITHDQLPVIKGYGTELRLLFQNLVSNAMKFQGKGVKPVVHIGYQRLEEHHKFTVKDNGIGIEDKYFDQIFVVFKRLHGRSEYEGTGIGLAHCKKVVDLHEGKIWVESELHQGTTFHISIPTETTEN